MKSNRIIIAILTLLAYKTASAETQPDFQGLGDLPGGPFESLALDLAPDGSAIVGRSRISGDRAKAFLWTPASGMIGLGDLPGGAYFSSGQAVSACGAVVVGTGSADPGTNTRHAFRWTPAGGMVDLGDLPGGRMDSAAYDVSSDGTTIVGIGDSGVSEAFLWTPEQGMVGLGFLNEYAYSFASAVSDDGSVIVGASESRDGRERQAFRWTELEGMIGLGDLPGGYYSYESVAVGISADGEVIVGMSESSLGDEAFLWNEDLGMVSLGDLPGGFVDARAESANDDGSLIVGYGATDLGEEAFIWDEQHGMRNLRTVLESEHGLDLTGWQLNGARGISDDGRVIAGFGANPNGQTEAWVAYIPEPSMFLMAITGVLAHGLLRCRQSFVGTHASGECAGEFAL